MRTSIASLSIALIAGAVQPLAYAPYGYPVLAVLSLAILFWLWDRAEPRSAAVTGFMFGLGMFGVGVSWVQISIHQFGLPMYSFSVAVTAAFVLILCLYPALCGYLAAKLMAPNRFLRIMCLYPAAWAGTELLRGWLFTGFPWLLVGYSQIDTPLSVFAPIVGVYGLGYITALVAAASVSLLRAERSWRAGAMVILGGIVVTVMALDSVRWTRVSGNPLTVAVIQGAVPQAVKWSPAYRQPSIDLYTQLSEPHWGKAMIIWPETAIPAFPDEVPETLKALTTKARDSATSLLVGMPSGDRTGNGEYFNSVVQLGAKSGRYDKHHLVPFGEYLPFDEWIRPLTSFLRIPMSDFSAGMDEQPLLLVNDHSIGVTICYEDAYADEVLRALPEAEVLVNVSNDAWFGDSIAPHQHLQIAQMRALESERYLIRATNTGISAIIDDRGRIVTVSKQFVSDVLSGKVIPRTGSTPVAKYGVLPTIALCLLLLSICGLSALRRPNS